MRNEQQNRRKVSNSSGYSSRLESLPPQELERRRRAARIRQIKRKRRRRKMILSALLVLFLAGGAGTALFYIGRDFLAGPVCSYSIKQEFASYQSAVADERAGLFADGLCVVSGDQPLDSVSLEEDQEGLLLDLNDQTVMYSKGAYERVYPASITKIMTALLAFQYGNMDDVVTITQENVTLEEGSQVIGFVPGDQVTMDQLVHGLLVYSGNDAASAIATHIGGSTEEFVSMMNSYAAKLGCTGTHFTNPHGLQDENHYTTPYDIYLMLKEALKYPEFTEITQMSSYTLTYKNSEGADMSVSLMATDQYLTGESTAPKGITILGGKTGTTSDAGNCLTLLCQDAYGEPYISIVMGASSKELLYKQMSSILQNVNTENNI